jgi:hypothetical protein
LQLKVIVQLPALRCVGVGVVQLLELFIKMRLVLCFASALVVSLFIHKGACETDLLVEDARGSIRMLALADWGGTDTAPFTTPSQLQTAAAMGVIGTLAHYLLIISVLIAQLFVYR